MTSDQKRARNIASRFKREGRYTVKICEDINEGLNNYCEAASEYELSTEQMLKYFHNMFDGEAKRFFRSNVVNNANTLETACQLMQNEFNSITRQNRMRRILQNLRLTQVMSTKKYSVSEGLGIFAKSSPSSRHKAQLLTARSKIKRNIFTMLIFAWTGQGAYFLRALRQRLHGHFCNCTRLPTPHGFTNKSGTIEIGETVNFFLEATIHFVFPAYTTRPTSCLFSKGIQITEHVRLSAPPWLIILQPWTEFIKSLPTYAVPGLTKRTVSIILVLVIIVEASITSLGTAIALSHLQGT